MNKEEIVKKLEDYEFRLKNLSNAACINKDFTGGAVVLKKAAEVALMRYELNKEK